jgi:hypothetical protein
MVVCGFFACTVEVADTVDAVGAFFFPKKFIMFSIYSVALCYSCRLIPVAAHTNCRSSSSVSLSLRCRAQQRRNIFERVKSVIFRLGSKTTLRILGELVRTRVTCRRITVESALVPVNSKQNNCLANIIETSDSEQEIDVDVDKELLEKNHVITTNTSTTQAQAQAQTPGRITKRVQFTIVEVREHAVTLGDHPLTESYPISLDWASPWAIIPSQSRIR